jgi:hypothetical protein
MAIVWHSFPATVISSHCLAWTEIDWRLMFADVFQSSEIVLPKVSRSWPWDRRVCIVIWH